MAGAGEIMETMERGISPGKSRKGERRVPDEPALVQTAGTARGQDDHRDLI